MKTEPNHPVSLVDNNEQYCLTTDKHGNSTPAYGLTKREYFVAMAMQGMLANSASQDALNQKPLSYANAAEIAEMACWQADALITALNKENK